MAHSRNGIAGEPEPWQSKPGVLMSKFNFRFVSRLSTVFIFWLVSCPLIGQVLPKKLLSPSEYDQWGTLIMGGLSPDGKWVHYTMGYENGNDTLFVKKTKGKGLYFFAGGTGGKFGDGTFACMSKENILSFVNLKSGSKRQFEGIASFEFSKDGRYCVIAETEASERQRLQILDKAGAMVMDIENVSQFSWDDGKAAISYSNVDAGRYTIGLIDLTKDCGKKVVENGSGVPTQLTFSRDRTTLTYYVTRDTVNEVHCNDLQAGKQFVLNTKKSGYSQLTIDTRQDYPLKLSDDGRKVFFGVRSYMMRDTLLLNEVAEVWYANDRKTYPLRRDIASIPPDQLLYMWEPDTNKLLQVTPDGEKLVIFTGKQRYAITGDQRPYLLQNKWIYDMDCYITDLNNGERKLLVKQQTGNLSGIAVSSEGRHIAYYHERDWFVYNVDTEMHVKITQGLVISWDDIDKDPVNDTRIHGCAGFTTNGNVLIYDEYDIWEISIDGLKRKRLTNGRENLVRYRFNTEGADIDARFYFDIGPVAYDLSRPKLLTALDLYNGGSGYSMIENGKVMILVDGVRKISRLEMVSDSQFAYLSESFSEPPSVKFNRKGNKPTTLYQSNEQFRKYRWGRSEMIHYEANGRPLNGALFYPAGFDPSMKYPLIVYIYDTVSRDVFLYKNPSQYDYLGFNLTHYTLNGYVVLMADISYGAGSPGIDATNCVAAAVDKVFKMGFIDARKIGLIGHSFGGYETNFIITNTNIFAAAVSGSGVADNIAHYFTFSKDYSRAEGWRYERQQYRMGKSIYEMQGDYIRNSPVLQASSITTPLLTWAGAKDNNVKADQSLIFYLALRRLGKKHIRLVYPDGGHILYDRKNQFDLTSRVQDWFDYFLKDKKDIDWISKGMKD
jgi:dipeptidyl aminopeptidase/acylaminoacyl peptidase